MADKKEPSKPAAKKKSETAEEQKAASTSKSHVPKKTVRTSGGAAHGYVEESIVLPSGATGPPVGVPVESLRGEEAEAVGLGAVTVASDAEHGAEYDDDGTYKSEKEKGK